MDYLLLHCPPFSAYTILDRRVLTLRTNGVSQPYFDILARAVCGLGAHDVRRTLHVDLAAHREWTVTVPPVDGWYSVAIRLADEWRVWFEIEAYRGRLTRVSGRCAFRRDGGMMIDIVTPQDG
jgi:hypothetical protein